MGCRERYRVTSMNWENLDPTDIFRVINTQSHIQKASLDQYLRWLLELLHETFPLPQSSIVCGEVASFSMGQSPWKSVPQKSDNCCAKSLQRQRFSSTFLQHFRSAIQTQLGRVVHLLCQSVVVWLLLFGERPSG